jgi:acetyltransferase
LDATVTHKTEVGGVHLGIENEQDLERALAAIDAIGAANARYLIEETAPKGPELIVGGRRDSSFGPTVLLGVGGTAAEAMKDVSLRLAPLSRKQAAGMLGELRGSTLFEGFRGFPAVDAEELSAMICALGDLLAGAPWIAEIDLNPVRVTADGLVVLDALVARESRASGPVS